MNDCCGGSWDGSPYVDENGDLKAIVMDEFGNHYTATIIKGKVAGYRCGPSVDGGPSHTFVIYAGSEIYVKVNSYLKDSRLIIDWIKGDELKMTKAAKNAGLKAGCQIIEHRIDIPDDIESLLVSSDRQKFVKKEGK